MRITLPQEVRMRGDDRQQGAMYSYISPEARVPHDHPLRAIRGLVDEVLRELSPRFEGLYAGAGRPSIAPEKLLRAQLLQVLYTVRSERQLMEQLDYNLLFRWFVGLSMDDPVWDFTVDGTLIEAWAGHKSFKRKDHKQTPPDDPGNASSDFHGERRVNATHQST